MDSQKYESIAIIKLSALGDIVHTIPAFDILRKNFPTSRITWFSEPAGAKLLQCVEGIDEIVSLNLKVKGVFHFIRNLKQALSVHRHRYDLIMDFQGLIKSSVWGWLLDGEVVGFAKKNLREPQARFFYSRTVPVVDESRHVIYKNMHLARSVIFGGADGSVRDSELNHPHYPLKPLVMSAALKDFMERNDLEANGYLILNIGGGWKTKILDFDQNLELIDGLKRKYKVVILWGNAPERERALNLGRKTGAIISDFFDFQDLILLIKQSLLIITADTLALHLADMVGKPSVGIFGPTSPARNGSLRPDSVSVLKKLSCGFCYKKKCGTIECIKKIQPGWILEAVGNVDKIDKKVNER
ncbi:MAG: glycosyltransferase family 9 protein [Candidatus Omnitrophota bacterium]